MVWQGKQVQKRKEFASRFVLQAIKEYAARDAGVFAYQMAPRLNCMIHNTTSQRQCLFMLVKYLFYPVLG